MIKNFNISTKDILTISGIIIFAIVIIIIGKKVANLLSGSEVKDYQEELKRSNLSYPDYQYQTFADTIFTAAHGWGTDEDAIYRTLQYLNNKDDWLYLVTVYSTDKDGFTLPARLNYELDKKEQQKVTDILSNIGVML